MRFEASWPVDYIDPRITQERHAPLECRVRGERAVDEWQHDSGCAETDRFGEGAEGEVVADAVGPFVDGVIGGRGDDDGIGSGE
jgi:hypothetical protein